jgi:hypothetical protein
MTYEGVMESPMQRLILLAKAIPKLESKNKENKPEKKTNIIDFAKNNNIPIKRKK